MQVPDKFKRWIHSLIFDKREAGTCIAISVKHIAGKSGGDVSRVKTPLASEMEEGEADSIIALFCDELWQQAQNDANAFQGLQTYGFYSWFDGQPDKSVNRYTARFINDSEDEEFSDDETASEPATKQGMLAAAMRHTEAFARIATQGVIHQLSMQQRTIDSQQRLIEKMTGDRLESLETIEELHSRKHERDMEMKETEAKVKLKVDFMERLAPLLPVVASKLTGVPLLPAGTKSAPAMKELLASVTEEQMGALTSILKPEQQALLANMMMEQQDDDAKEAKENTH